VPVNPYDPDADLVDIVGGVYVNTVGTDCGGFTVTGGFYSAYQALGGKGVVGDPLSRVTVSASGREQLFDGVVLADPRSAVRALPIVARLAAAAPAAYRRAGLPPAYAHSAADTAQRRHWLTNQAIASAYLAGKEDTPASYAAAVQRYGEPLGRPKVLPDGEVGQAFSDVVLEAPRKGGSAHAAAVVPTALAAGTLHVSATARGLQPRPPLPDPSPLGPPQPDTVEPFVLTLGAALLAYGGAIAAIARRQRRRRRAAAVGYQREEVAV
jgi:hypothetical protein